MIPYALRQELKEADLIFLPHHGTNTANSQRWLGYFANDRRTHCFVISSSPFGTDKTPKRSTIELAPELPRHPSHLVIYSQDMNNIQSFRMTNRPIYITDSASGGVECFAITHEKTILKLDVYKREDNELYRWFDILQSTKD